MRNAGDRVPGGPSGRRQRGASTEQPPPADRSGGASLFTPAYRVNHAAAGTRPVGRDGSGPPTPAGPEAGHGGAPSDPPGSGYPWADSESGPPGIGYQQAGYDAAAGGPAWPDDDLAAGYLWTAEYESADAWPGAGLPGTPAARAAVVSNAVRGFPPAPGESLPVYPPGPFAAWNRSPADRPGSERAGQGNDPRSGGYADSATQLATATITPDEFDTNHSIPAIKDPVLAARPAGPATPAQPGAGPRPVRTASRPGRHARARPRAEDGRAKAGGPRPRAAGQRRRTGQPAEAGRPRGKVGGPHPQEAPVRLARHRNRGRDHRGGGHRPGPDVSWQ